MYKVTIYAGPHYTDPVAYEYETIAPIDTVREGARVKCRQMIAVRGLRTWVDVVDAPTGAPITHWNFDETPEADNPGRR